MTIWTKKVDGSKAKAHMCNGGCVRREEWDSDEFLFRSTEGGIWKAKGDDVVEEYAS